MQTMKPEVNGQLPKFDCTQYCHRSFYYKASNITTLISIIYELHLRKNLRHYK